MNLPADESSCVRIVWTVVRAEANALMYIPIDYSAGYEKARKIAPEMASN